MARLPLAVLKPLTDREREVLRHMADLRTNREIAERLYISDNTVRTHVRHIFDKLGTCGRGEAVRQARDLDLL